MAHATTPAPVGVLNDTSKTKTAAKILVWTGIVALAVGFIIKYVLFYYRHYDAASFDVYWPRRGWLFLHINGGTLALLMGPWQFWTGLRQRNLAIHRWTGRLFLLGVAMGVIGSIGLIATTTFGWAFATGIAGLASAWLVTTSMAYGCIAQRVDGPRLRGYVRVCDVSHSERLWSNVAPDAGERPEHHDRMGVLGRAPGRHGDDLPSQASADRSRSAAIAIRHDKPL
jgi:hypothetical protein